MTVEEQKPVELAKPTDTAPEMAKPEVDLAKAADAAKPDLKAEADSKYVEKSEGDKQESKPDGAPESYDLKVPENSLLGDAHVETLKSYAKEKGLSNEQAQTLLDRENNAVQAGIEAITQRAQKQSEAWLAEAKADKEIGGEKFAENVEIARGALDALFPGVDIRQFMDNTGFGNNPGVLKGFVKIGKMLQPDKFNQSKGQPPIKREPQKIMYDHPTSNLK